MSESSNGLGQQMFKLRTAIAKMKFDSDKNPFFKSEYIALDTMLKMIEPECGTLGLTMTQEVLRNDSGVNISTVFEHSDSKDRIYYTFYMPISNTDPQKYIAQITYGKRAALSAIFGIVVRGEDDDGNTASSKQTPQEKRMTVAEIKTKLVSMHKTANDVSVAIATLGYGNTMFNDLTVEQASAVYKYLGGK